MVYRQLEYLWLLIWLLLIVGCSAETSNQANNNVQSPVPPTPIVEPALVESVELTITGFLPKEVTVTARGELTDECTAITAVEQSYQNSHFQVTIQTNRQGVEACVGTPPVPFEETLSLEVINLPAGIYTVQVNGVQELFTFQEDNIKDDRNAIISGQVWHDLCAGNATALGANETTLAGCVPAGNGGYRANGRFEENESGLGGVTVLLGQGSCPAEGLAITITDENGFFIFSGLTAGTYCLTVAADSAANQSLLIPGLWTQPQGPGEMTITIKPGEMKTDANFGWDYQFLPAVETTTGQCVDDATFVADLTVTDDTALAPGETFTKTWQLRNDGTCLWGSTYSVVFVDGDQMDGPASSFLPQVVEPGQTIDLSLVLTTPETPGTYRAEWKLRNSAGVLFGIGPEADTPFWVQIIVANPETENDSEVE